MPYRVLAISALWCLASVAHAHGDAHGNPAAASDIDLSGIDQREAQFAEVVRVAPAPLINPSIGGRWSDVYDWPLVAVHAALLPNGKVLAWDATPDDADDDPHTTDNYTTRVTLWDPIADTHVETNNDTDTDLFCAGSAHLWDGRILFAGGDGGRAGANGPLANSNIYNPVSNTWHRTENMNAPRWYSSVAALANGEMLTLGGTYTPQPIGEVFQFDQTWRPLAGDIPRILNEDYQWLQQTPEGSVLYFGPSDLLVDIQTDGAGNYNPRAIRDSVEARDYGSYAMYDVGKILVAGGEQGLISAVVVDTASRQATDTNPLNFGRRQHNLTILADGTVLATGGNSDGAQYYSPTAGVMETELWNPDTQSWTVQNPIPTDRQYHSIALLLPDATVLSAGGGICGDCYRLNYEERNAEIFSPAYLFNRDGSEATRPTLSGVPEVLDYAEQATVNFTSSNYIEKMHLIKLGSVTHSENQDQRLIPLQFNRSANNLTLSMPLSRNIAPPGHYMLFAIDSSGVPSKAAMIKLGQPLVGDDQVVRSTLESNVWDSYLSQPTVGKTFVDVSAAAGSRLFVSAKAPVRSANQADLICDNLVPTSGYSQCNIDVAPGTQLHISLTGAQRSDYSLRFKETGEASTISPVEPINPTTPTDPGTPTGPTTPFVPPTTTNPTPPVQNPNYGGGPVTPPTNEGKVRTGVGSITLSWVLLLAFSRFIRSIKRWYGAV